MKYIIRFSDPAGGAEQRAAVVEGDRVVLDDVRHHLTVLDADGELVAGFINWHSFAPEDAEQADS